MGVIAVVTEGCKEILNIWVCTREPAEKFREEGKIPTFFVDALDRIFGHTLRVYFTGTQHMTSIYDTDIVLLTVATCYRTSDGRDYQGPLSITVSNHTCQRWTSQNLTNSSISKFPGNPRNPLLRVYGESAHLHIRVEVSVNLPVNFTCWWSLFKLYRWSTILASIFTNNLTFATESSGTKIDIKFGENSYGVVHFVRVHGVMRCVHKSVWRHPF